MLAAEGHRILHSTRHSSIELGKDVITINSDGDPCGFQLKGNPGARMTLNAFREIQPQVNELLNTPITLSGVPNRPHKSFLVTNGYVEEEAALAIREMNEANERDGYPHRKLLVLQRGDLLDMAKRLGHSLWPKEIEQIHLLLEMLVEQGTGSYPIERAHSMLSKVLGLDPASRQKWGAAELRRRVTSASLMVSTSLMNFSRTNNHAAVITAWAHFCAAAMGACDRYGVSFARNAETAVGVAAYAIRDSLIDLAKEVLDRRDLVEGDPMVDGPFYRARHSHVLGLLSLLWFWLERDGWPPDLKKEDLERFLIDGKDELYVWGEGAIPQTLLYYWFRRKVAGGIRNENLLAQLLMAMTARDEQDRPIGFASPYWDFEAVARHELAPILGRDQDPMREEAIGGRSFFAEALLHLLVRANRKQACIQLWPDLTRIQFAEFQPKKRWQHCLFRCKDGDNSEQLREPRQEWKDLIQEARSVRCETVPSPFLERPFIHMLYLLHFPHRARPDVIRHISRAFDATWLISDGPLE
jgi:hypothetical protein